MVILAILILTSILVFCRLCFSAATFALPVCAGAWAGFTLLHANAGWVFALLAGVFTGITVLIAGHFAIGCSRHPLVQGTIALCFFAPAAFVGYSFGHALMIALHQPGWSCVAVAAVGGTITGITAIRRVMTLTQSAEQMPSAMA